MNTLKKNIGTLSLLLLAFICLLVSILSNHQAALSKPGQLHLSGEYSRDGKNWLPLTDASLSAREGTLYLRGHFDSDIPEGLRIYWYRDHIGVNVSVNDEWMGTDTVAMLLEEGQKITPDVCGSLWDYQLSPGITPEDTVEFTLYNPHPHGNHRAAQEFLDNIFVTGNTPVALQGYLKPFSTPIQGVGLVFILVALLILGAALASAVMRPFQGTFLWSYGLLCLFAGGFVFLDTVNISFLTELIVFNTYGKLLCGILAVYFGQLCLSSTLTDGRRKVANTILLFSSLLDCILILSSFTGKLLYDGFFYWRLSQLVLCPLWIGCALAELFRQKEHRHLTVSGLLLMGALLLDMVGLGAGMYSHGTCSKLVFLVLFGYEMIQTVQHMVLDYRGDLRAKELERELEDSRISAMLSQMQPHFLYNVLNSIYQLCEVDPGTAQDAIEKFSDYLRNNMASLTEKNLIPFREEYRHIQTYLSLEKIRFPNTLRVTEDIQTSGFQVPPLTVQVVVENAVKHGVTKKRGGGTVTISTREASECWLITVSDTGKGFDPAHYDEDGKAHFGLRNAQERLRTMVGGTLVIQSAEGQGTTVEIRIPKGDRRCE